LYSHGSSEICPCRWIRAFATPMSSRGGAACRLRLHSPLTSRRRRTASAEPRAQRGAAGGRHGGLAALDAAATLREPRSTDTGLGCRASLSRQESASQRPHPRSRPRAKSPPRQAPSCTVSCTAADSAPEKPDPPSIPTGSMLPLRKGPSDSLLLSSDPHLYQPAPAPCSAATSPCSPTTRTCRWAISR
jgi:hypothetical protein